MKQSKTILDDQCNISQLYVDIFEKAPIGIYTIDQTGIIDFFNPKMLELSGAKKIEEVLGLNVFKMKSYKKAGLDKYFRQGLQGKSFEIETEYISQTGQKKTYRHYHGVPILGSNSKVARLLLMVEDTTSRRLAEERICASEEKYRTIFELSPEAIVILDKKGRFLDMNNRVTEWLGYNKSEALGKNMLDLGFITPKSKSLASKNLTERMKGAKIASYEMDFIAKDGKKKTGIILANAIKNEQGEDIADLVMIHDITERKRVEEMKTEFVSISSHQLRTPLTGIKWCTELLLKDTDAKNFNEKQNKLLDQIVKSNERMIKLVNDLLDVSRIETGQKFTIRKKTIDIKKILTEVMDDNVTAIKEKNINIELDLDQKTKVKADPEKMAQAWQNLIDNAIKYSKNGSKIHILSKSSKSEILFTIEDHGMGIPQEEQSRVFDKFFRAKNASVSENSGTGLGLYIVKSIIEGHGGKIKFKSQEGKGTTFYISLPL